MTDSDQVAVAILAVLRALGGSAEYENTVRALAARVLILAGRQVTDDEAWGAGVRHLRGNGLLRWSRKGQSQWSLGDDIAELSTAGWPDDNARALVAEHFRAHSGKEQ